ALCEKCLGAFAKVLGAAARCDGPALILHLGLETAVSTERYKPLGPPERGCRSSREIDGKFTHLLGELCGRIHLIDDAEVLRLARRQRAVRAHKLKRAFGTYQARQEERRTAVGRKPDRSVCEREPNVIGGQYKVAGECQTEARTGGGP